MVVKLDPVQVRILRILKDWYPITVEELKDEMSARPTTVERALKGLMLQGIIVFEPLTDKTYIRLLVPDINLDSVGSNKGKTRVPRDESDDVGRSYQ
jgi:predicted transcriptional regulator